MVLDFRDSLDSLITVDQKMPSLKSKSSISKNTLKLPPTKGCGDFLLISHWTHKK